MGPAYCAGKIGYPGEAEAREALRALRQRARRRGAKDRRARAALMAFPCPCGAWHLGTRTRRPVDG